MIDYAKGSLTPKDDLTLPYIWVSLHLNARMEQDTLSNPRLARETTRMADEIRYLLKALDTVPVQNWWDLCEASGWTVYGAVGLSWCKGATAAQFWRAWDLVKYPLEPGDAAERPCTFINPAFLPDTPVLTGIVEACGNACTPICVSIAALREPLLIDVSVVQIDQAEPPLRVFLRSRLQSQPVGAFATQEETA